MKKLFLTSFEFTTDGLKVKDQRLVVVTKKDIEAIPDDHDIPRATNITNPKATAAASAKAYAWFKVNYPQSELHYLGVHEAIE